MMETLTKKEVKEKLKELIKFCKENHILMYRYMLTIKQIRKEPEDKILMEKLKKQAEDYKKKSFHQREMELAEKINKSVNGLSSHI